MQKALETSLIQSSEDKTSQCIKYPEYSVPANMCLLFLVPVDFISHIPWNTFIFSFLKEKNPCPNPKLSEAPHPVPLSSAFAVLPPGLLILARITELLPEQRSAFFGRPGQIVFQARCLFGHMAFCLGFQVFPHTKALHLSPPHPALAFLQDSLLCSLPQPCSVPAHQTRSSAGFALVCAGSAPVQIGRAHV